MPMEPDTPEARRLRTALDLYDAAVDLMRQNLRRRHPEASEAERERMLVEWLLSRPGAPDGDAVGRRVWRDLG